jgi:hypothetical protein
MFRPGGMRLAGEKNDAHWEGKKMVSGFCTLGLCM